MRPHPHGRIQRPVLRIGEGRQRGHLLWHLLRYAHCTQGHAAHAGARPGARHGPAHGRTCHWPRHRCQHCPSRQPTKAALALLHAHAHAAHGLLHAGPHQSPKSPAPRPCLLPRQQLPAHGTRQLNAAAVRGGPRCLGEGRKGGGGACSTPRPNGRPANTCLDRALLWQQQQQRMLCLQVGPTCNLQAQCQRLQKLQKLQKLLNWVHTAAPGRQPVGPAWLLRAAAAANHPRAARCSYNRLCLNYMLQKPSTEAPPCALRGGQDNGSAPVQSKPKASSAATRASLSTDERRAMRWTEHLHARAPARALVACSPGAHMCKACPTPAPPDPPVDEVEVAALRQGHGAAVAVDPLEPYELGQPALPARCGERAVHACRSMERQACTGTRLPHWPHSSYAPPLSGSDTTHHSASSASKIKPTRASHWCLQEGIQRGAGCNPACGVLGPGAAGAVATIGTSGLHLYTSSSPLLCSARCLATQRASSRSSPSRAPTAVSPWRAR